jgi:DNA-binding NtrC family response regulator
MPLDVKRCSMKGPQLLIVSRDESLSQMLGVELTNCGYAITQATEDASALKFCHAIKPALVIIGACSRNAADDLKVVDEIHKHERNMPVVLIAMHSSEELAIASLRAGVNDYLKMPFSSEELLACIHKHVSVGRREIPDFPTNTEMIGNSKAMGEISSFLAKIAASDSTVLITGETGTGKELAAAMIHEQSARRKEPFVCVNCAALPENLVESELFGYERGAFTGAFHASLGKFEVANGGTVFLDEICDMTSFAQAKLLRTIESREIYRLGGKKVIPLDVRITAATNKDPEAMVSAGKFREDLYYRLNVARIHLPPLRERQEDIRCLISYGIAKLNRKYRRNVQGLSEEAIILLMRYDWPGNVRELMNLLEATFINLPQKEITFADLPKLFQQKLKETESIPGNERKRILSALLETKWNKAEAARKLQWSRMTLYRKISRYNIVEQSGPARR